MITFLSISQTGGTNAFPFLNLTYNARAAGLAGEFITAKDSDINLGIANPSLLNKDMHKTLGLNQAILPAGISYGMVSYGHHLDNIGTLSGYIKYINYGKFQRTNVNGTEDGKFNPFEMVIGSGIGKQLNPLISVGGNISLLYSQLETYSSFGAGIDLSGTYYNESKGILVTAMVKNAGIQFDPYVKKGNRNPLPANFLLASSYKLAHAPFRISITAHDLNKWDLTYNDPTLKPTIDVLTGDTIPVPTNGFFEKFARHLSYQVEGIVSKNIHLRIGFDYQKRKELRLEQRPGAAGFTFGAGLYFNKFSLDYGFVVYSRAGFNNMLTFTTNLSKWRK
jgi:hypothetical protein